MNAFFVGIGGMGMSGLAKILHVAGFKVAGSDRNPDGEYARKLAGLGIPLYPQDGSGIAQFLTSRQLAATDLTIVKSTAVEDQVPDIVAARQLGLREIMRSDLLAQLFNAHAGIAIGGSSGKTTTSGLMAWVLKFAGLDPSCAIGGLISGLDTNAFTGKGPHFVIEADESDGSIVKYSPFVSVLTNVSRDHKSLDELHELFSTFLGKTSPKGRIIVGIDDPEVQAFLTKHPFPVTTFGLSAKADIRPQDPRFQKAVSTFTYKGTSFTVSLPGPHNLQNALAVLAVAEFLGIPIPRIAEAVRAFPGMKRRFERVGVVNGVTVVDDFAHNPAEIRAAINAARQASKRRFIIYQPHGYGPTRFTRNDLVTVFKGLEAEETLFLDEIFYGGGTVEKDISSQDIINEVRQTFPNAFCPGTREEIIEKVAQQAKDGDMVLVMGARDINTICPRILDSLRK